MVLFLLCIWNLSTIFSHLHLLPSPSPYYKYSPHSICFMVLSFIFNFKVSVQRDFSMYPSCECTVLGPVQPITLPHLFPPIPYDSIAFSTYPTCTSTCTDVMHLILLMLILLFSFPSSQVPREVAPLQICSTYKCVCDRVCFCVYIYLLELSSTYERKHVVFVFQNLYYLTFFFYHSFTWKGHHFILSFFLMTE
jgi:hypothetical protein